MKSVIKTFIFVVLFIIFTLSYIYFCIYMSKYYSLKTTDEIYNSTLRTNKNSIYYSKYNKNLNMTDLSLNNKDNDKFNNIDTKVKNTDESKFSILHSNNMNSNPLNNNLRNSKFRDYNVFPDNTTVHSSSEYNEGFEFGIGKCDHNSNCFLPYGVCVNSTTCICMPDYANIQEYKYHPNYSYFFNYDVKYNNNLYCSYTKKKVVVAALLELFLPLSLGHFYAQQYILGYVKLFYNFGVYLFGFILYYKGIQDNSKFGSIGICLFLFCIIPVWNLIDVQMFLTYAYKDGFGIPMN